MARLPSPSAKDVDDSHDPYHHHQHYFTAPSFSSLFNVNSRQNIIQDEDLLEGAMLRGRVHRPSLSTSLNRGLGIGPYSSRAFPTMAHTPMELLKIYGKRIDRARTAFTLTLTPLLLSPLLLVGGTEMRCAFCVLLMAVYWMTEAVPLAVTAMLPTVLFPLAGILPAKAVAREFFNDTIFLFIGGLIVATAVEKSELQQRLALRILTLAGSNPRWIMLGFMVVTAGLSMFISNTATTAMMVPIGESIISQLMGSSRLPHHHSRAPMESLLDGLLKNGGARFHESARGELRMAKGLILSLAYAANIGGIGTLTGTPPNLVMVGVLPTLFPSTMGVNYVSWMAFALPLACLCLLVGWLILCAVFMSSAPSGDSNISAQMRRRYQELPPMSYAEKSVSVCFLLLLLMWMGREPGVVPGIATLFPAGYFTDSTSAMLVATILFMLPSENPYAHGDKIGGESAIDVERRRGRLMDWPTMQQKFPWNVVILLGGGLALAAGVKESGLSDLIGHALGHLHTLPHWSLQLLCILIVMLTTNVCSNTVTASIFVPIAAGMAKEAGMHPLELLLPVTIACSFAFILPVGTPPNAIVFAAKSGVVKVVDMIAAGSLISLTLSVIMVVYVGSFAHLVFPAIDSTLTPPAGWTTNAGAVSDLMSSPGEESSYIAKLLNSSMMLE